jgi:phenylalanyl-tRNA synthetase beta chain
MKLPLNWLKDYIDPKLSTDKLIDRLTMAGLEVEAVESMSGDTIFEIEITPNRPDCLNILGLAREIGAMTGRKVKSPAVTNRKIAPLANAVRVENKKDCSRYIATLLRGVHIKESSPRIKQRLASAGLNAINNAVDITNFVLMETGQPLHAFDYDKLAGGAVEVRRARAGESMVTLDGVERKLDSSILVIADDQGPVAIAGIMGGARTQITAETKNILLESAHFEMGIIRRGCRTLGLRSDSSYRFERNVDFEGVLTGANRAVDLLMQSAGGRLAGRGEMVSKAKSRPAQIKIRARGIEDLLGVEIALTKAKAWLVRLGFKVSVNAGIMTVMAPSHRPDIRQDVDVIEEIARMIGFDKLPSRLPEVKAVNIPVDKRPCEIKTKLRDVMTAGGIDEIITLSMINARALSNSGMSHLPAVRIFNPLSQDQELMRPSLLPSMLHAALANINRGQKDLRFFEIGKRYFTDGEKETAGVLLTGRRFDDWRLPKKDMVDLFDLKGILDRAFELLGLHPVFEAGLSPAIDEASSAVVLVNGAAVGSLGKIDKDVLNNWEIKNQDVYFAEIYLDQILTLPARPLQYRPFSEYPAIVRDVSLAVKKEVPYKRIEEICHQQGADVLKAVNLIEQYLGDKIPHGYRGLVFSCQYQSDSRTLREDEVSSVHERILQALMHDLGAIRR